MLINLLNFCLLIISMSFSTINGQSDSTSESNESGISRSRRQINQDNYIKTCKDECVKSQISAVIEHIYTLKELHKICSIGCQKEIENIYENNKQTKQQKIQDIDYSLQSITSGKVDCEIKCLANKDNNNSLQLKKRKEFCRNKCSTY
ncbi:unnamed protein product [Adineta steineri]|uniref:Transmembrane protein n=1 Tax=Adineta steineri TaxID=433720 RepID=A0A818HER3_9BILA|nr:unnamed protein product [Adineta steineri]